MSTSRKKPRFSTIFLAIIIFSLIGSQFAFIANGEPQSVEPKEIMELTQERTEFSTRYLNPDGSYTEEIYLEPQFYQDTTDKKWKKINNNLKKNNKNAKHETTANAFKASFADEMNENELVTVEKGGKSISLIPLNAKKVKGKVENNEITYTGMYDDVDIRYQVKGSAVKEDIILHRLPSSNIFTFEMKLKGLTATTNSDGIIVFEDNKGSQQFYFQKPYMFDANGTYSDAVTLSLREEKGKTYVDVIADSAFLEDPSTQYPVTIDPTVDNWDVSRDMFVSSIASTTSFSSESNFKTGLNNTFGTTRSFVSFFIPTIPTDSTITYASFHAYQLKDDPTMVSIDLYRVTSPWEEPTTTFNNQPTVGASPESTTTNNIVNDYWEWDITELARDWYSGTQANYGFMLKQQNESTSPSREFRSVTGGNFTPRITIHYTLDPIEPEVIQLNTPLNVSVQSGESNIYEFIPNEDGLYKIHTYSNGVDSDTYLHLFSDMELTNELTFNDDANDVYSEIQYELQAGVSYYIKYRGYSDEAASSWLEINKIVLVPDSPIGFTATQGNGEVQLNWDVNTGVDSYNIKRSEVSGGPYSIISSGVTTSSYTDTNVNNGTTYYYVVSAVNGSGESANSNEVVATPEAVITVPEAPTNLNGITGDSFVDLSWNAANNADSYIVKRATTSSGPYSTVASNVSGTTYSDSSVTNGTTYYYVVSAVNIAGESGNSNEISVTPEGAPSNVTDSFEPNDSIETAHAMNVGQFLDSYVSSSADKDFYQFTATDSGIYHVDLNVPAGVRYGMYVYDENQAIVGEGNWTNDVYFLAESGKNYSISIFSADGSFSETPYNLLVDLFGTNEPTDPTEPPVNGVLNYEYEYDANGNLINVRVTSVEQ
ncbi:DNRLRE domain-containing protein [Chengkuizengella sediminis]|uniref:DNRLRE domain-containing protein n=1 Tax=Chengkuizengella sediminis TaxID=1885917 RepID=UPI00138A17DC|nr:DNRLRE domain-containing protein [Chengkuizengella sediminis]NDI33805.1 DNRLRE domain-containing protein [Chengkuizengella sediminis]